MSMIYLSTEANPLLKQHLSDLGHQCKVISANPQLPWQIATHPDLIMCKMGCQPEDSVFWGNPDKLGSFYPKDICYNGACTGKYFLHHLKYTDSRLLSHATQMGMELIQVPQGYSKCNTVIVDEGSIITSDEGIYRAFPSDCLLITPGNVELSGHSYGFLGGASGRIGKAILFHGALNRHPDFQKIVDYISSKGLQPIWFETFPLTDIGSIIEYSGVDLST